MCVICLDDITPDEQAIHWPGCRHACHTQCAGNHVRVHRCPSPGRTMPSFAHLRRLVCPHRGDALPASAGLAIEACMQRWGNDQEARDTYDRLAAAYNEEASREQAN
eukprot:2458264-Karenia_brevis.AAC.1